MELNYFIFTSGEKGVHGLDWGIKFSSGSLKNPRELDDFYRKKLSEFNLSPSLERPDKSGLLLIPFDEKNLLGFIFPNYDLKGRPNTTTILCEIPDEISKRFNVSEVIKNLCASNNLAEISVNKNTRPDTLLFNENFSGSNDFLYSDSMSWPNINNGYISLDEKITELNKKTEPQKIKRSNKKIIFAACLIISGLIIFYGVSKFSFEKIVATAPQPVIKSEKKEIKINENKNLTLIKNDDFAGEFYRAGALINVDDKNFNFCGISDINHGFIDKNSFNKILKSLYLEKSVGKPELKNKGMLLIFSTGEKNKADFKSEITKIFYSADSLKPQKSEIKNSNKDGEKFFFRTNYPEIFFVSVIENGKLNNYIASEAPLFNKDFFIREILRRIDFNADDAEISLWNGIKDKNSDINFCINAFVEQSLKKIPSEIRKLKGAFNQR